MIGEGFFGRGKDQRIGVEGILDVGYCKKRNASESQNITSTFFVKPSDVIKLMDCDNSDAEFEVKTHPKTGKLTIEMKKE